jgi:Cu/Ag efflux protein CusF
VYIRLILLSVVCVVGLSAAIAFRHPDITGAMTDVNVGRRDELCAHNSDTNLCIETTNKNDRVATVASSIATFKGTGFLKTMNSAKGTITVDYGWVQSMGWPFMLTVTFVVRDKNLFDQLAAGKQVEIEFRKEGADYVLTGARNIPPSH